MIILKNFPLRKKIAGITLWPFILVKMDNPTRRLIRHEQIHLRQQLELLIIPFYIWYLIEWLIRWSVYKDKDKAYRNISFEREAYQNDLNADYLWSRGFWKFLKYL